MSCGANLPIVAALWLLIALVAKRIRQDDLSIRANLGRRGKAHKYEVKLLVSLPNLYRSALLSSRAAAIEEVVPSLVLAIFNLFSTAWCEMCRSAAISLADLC